MNALRFLGASLAIGHALNGGTLTVVTHGFNSNANPGGWVRELARSISNYPRRVAEYGYDTTPVYRLYFSGGRLFSERVSGPTYDRAPSGDIVVALDWNPYSGTFTGSEHLSTEVVGDYVARQLAGVSGFVPELNGVMTQLPIHLIGHSRGGSLVCEIAKGLGKIGIYVDHMTLLDPHPVNNDGFESILEQLFVPVTDGSAYFGVYQNVGFCDTYFQTSSIVTPQGTSALGAYNRLLNSYIAFDGGYGSDHSNVHFWYFCTTTDNSPLPTSNGEASLTLSQRQNWFAQNEDLGRKAGYFASERGGGQSLNPAQFISGLNGRWLRDLGVAGVPDNRTTVIGREASAAANVVDLAIETGAEEQFVNFQLGGPIDIAVMTEGDSGVAANLYYQSDDQHQTTIRLFADEDENAVNGVAKEVLYSLPSTGSKNVERRPLQLNEVIDGLKPALYRIGVEIRKGTSFKRHRYSSQRLMILPRLRCDWVPTFENGVPAFNVVIRGLRDKRFAIEASPDLKEWIGIATGQLRSASTTELEGIDAWNQISRPAEDVHFFRVRYLD
jgi:hypothetical protein